MQINTDQSTFKPSFNVVTIRNMIESDTLNHDDAERIALAIDTTLKNQDTTGFATKGDIQDLKQTTQNDIKDLKQATQKDIADVKTELKQEIAEVKSELKQEIAEVKSELKQDIKDLELRLTNKIYILHFSTISIILGIIGKWLGKW